MERFKKITMKVPIRLIWQCLHCKDVVISYSHLRHHINYCECGESAVDLEDHYQGRTGDKIMEISRKENINGKWVSVKNEK